MCVTISKALEQGGCHNLLLLSRRQEHKLYSYKVTKHRVKITERWSIKLRLSYVGFRVYIQGGREPAAYSYLRRDKRANVCLTCRSKQRAQPAGDRTGEPPHRTHFWGTGIAADSSVAENNLRPGEASSPARRGRDDSHVPPRRPGPPLLHLHHQLLPASTTRTASYICKPREPCGDPPFHSHSSLPSTTRNRARSTTAQGQRR